MATSTATLPSILESKMYVAVDPTNNNNKYWKYERYSAPSLKTARRVISRSRGVEWVPTILKANSALRRKVAEQAKSNPS